MKNETLFNESHQATYCPEDDKLRLYVGRVPRDEYEALRREGWTSTPKQECDFVAVWTPAREDTALSYAGVILDEDQSPQDRAADRAERFAGYREKRIGEASGLADRFDSGPSVHGFQNKARAVRAADRHDRIAGRAVNAWDKAEYWQRRTAGVIDSALYKSRPDVRMGRVKTLESERRKAEESGEAYKAKWAAVSRIAEDPAAMVAEYAPKLPRYYIGEEPEPETPEEETRRVAESLADGCTGYGEQPHPEDPGRAPGYPSKFFREHSDPVSLLGAYARQWLAGHLDPGAEDYAEVSGNARHCRHLTHRLAYEWQMLEAQGGRAAAVEMEKGGTLGGRVVAKVNKSPKTGRVVSVAVIGPAVEGWAYKVQNVPGTEKALYSIDTERLGPDAYKPPTDESRAALAEFEAACKAKRAKAPKAPPLINPTEDEAEQIQDAFNEAHRAAWEKKHGYTVEEAPSYYTRPEAKPVVEMTQAEYSAASRGSYARAETKHFHAGPVEERGGFATREKAVVEALRLGPVVCKLRVTGYEPRQVVRITDKPGKKLPAAFWKAYEVPEECTPDGLAPRASELVAALRTRGKLSEDQTHLIRCARVAGLVVNRHGSPAMSEAGHEWARELGAYSEA